MGTINSYIFYHSADFDGFLSCALIAFYLKYHNRSFVLKPYNYGQDLDLASLDRNAVVYAADISFEPDIMKIFKTEFKDFIWIDHHISAIDKSVEFGYSDISGLRAMNMAACGLVWAYFDQRGFNFTDSLKFNYTCVKWISDYDIWDHKDTCVVPFQYGLRVENLNPKSDFALNKWRNLLTSTTSYLKQIVKRGQNILDYLNQDNRVKCFNRSYVVDFENYKCLCANYISNSMFFDKVYNENKHDLMLLYSFHPKFKQFSCSLYSTKENVDCSKIAQKYGGGGHFHAAGFKLTVEQFANLLIP